jgi:hypothetical protein
MAEKKGEQSFFCCDVAVIAMRVTKLGVVAKCKGEQ